MWSSLGGRSGHSSRERVGTAGGAGGDTVVVVGVVVGVEADTNWDSVSHCPCISVFKAPLVNLRQLEKKVFKNSTGLKKHVRIFLKMFSSVVFPQLPESFLFFSLT